MLQLAEPPRHTEKGKPESREVLILVGVEDAEPDLIEVSHTTEGRKFLGGKAFSRREFHFVAARQDFPGQHSYQADGYLALSHVNAQIACVDGFTLQRRYVEEGEYGVLLPSLERDSSSIPRIPYLLPGLSGEGFVVEAALMGELEGLIRKVKKHPSLSEWLEACAGLFGKVLATMEDRAARYVPAAGFARETYAPFPLEKGFNVLGMRYLRE